LRKGLPHDCKKKDLETKLNEDGSIFVNRKEIKHFTENTWSGAITL
jgi:hypothetical protein